MRIDLDFINIKTSLILKTMDSQVEFFLFYRLSRGISYYDRRMILFFIHLIPNNLPIRRMLSTVLT